jgi:hypothetical protein
MKRLAIVFVLMICLAAVAFATLQSAKNKASTKSEKKKECKERKAYDEKKECNYVCPLSS